MGPDHERRFWALVDRKAPDACWEWRGQLDPQRDYGVLLRQKNRRRMRLRAHRVAYELVYGPIPEGMLVLHACDNPPCCNPAHLSLGTHEENRRQKIDRRRHLGVGRPPGLTNGQRRAQVIQCYHEGRSIRETASLLGMHYASVTYHRRMARLEGALDAPP